MKETVLISIALLAWHWGANASTTCGTPPAATAEELAFSSNPSHDPDPEAPGDASEILEIEKSENDGEWPGQYGVLPGRYVGASLTPRATTHATREVAAAVRPAPLAAPMRC